MGTDGGIDGHAQWSPVPIYQHEANRSPHNPFMYVANCAPLITNHHQRPSIDGTPMDGHAQCSAVPIYRREANRSPWNSLPITCDHLSTGHRWMGTKQSNTRM